MKKLFLILSIAIGMIATSACNSCVNNAEPVEATEFVYDVTATANGEGKFTWQAAPHVGEVVLAGKVEITATNDTTTVSVFAATSVNGAPTLSAGCVSNNPEEAAAAQEVVSRLSTTHIEGDYQLDVVGYAKYGPFYFVIDEHYPPVNVETAE